MLRACSGALARNAGTLLAEGLFLPVPCTVERVFVLRVPWRRLAR